jgi:DNA mismatch endonuclease (patch repair protein)
LRRELWRLGLRFRLDARELAGRPDIVFRRQKVVVFCDGDFWHGRDLQDRLHRLQQGHNAAYWTQKIRSNVDRDRQNDAALRAEGWTVLRVWESDIRKDAASLAKRIADLLQEGAASSTG